MKKLENGSRKGFSLVELVVVVLIMGIIAAVAAPRLFDKMTDARESASKTSLSVLRGALDLYQVENSATYPTAATLVTDLQGSYIRSAFPSADVKSGGTAAVVATTQDPIANPDADSDASWIYNESTGEIRINDANYIAW